MHLRGRFRSLLAQSVLRIILPLSLVMLGVIAAGVLVNQQVVTSLLVERDRQFATLFASSVSETLAGYARVLEALASNVDVRNESAEVRVAVLQGAAEALEVFNAGVAIVDGKGAVLTAVPADFAAVQANAVEREVFQFVRAQMKPVFSDVVSDARTGEDVVVVAVPILDDASSFAGALLGVVRLKDSSLGGPVKKLAVGEGGFAYLVDRHGRVVFHPQVENIGIDFTNRPSVQQVIAGESGGMVWDAPSGQRVVHGYAPVGAAGWGLIVQESWEQAVAPVQVYGLVEVVAGLIAIGVAVCLAWLGVRRITGPIRHVAAQASRLASGENIEPISVDGIAEIEALVRAFDQMAARIATYRAGLRRYVGAITKSQEDERRRIARELHDETAHSLLTIARRLELHQASESDPDRLARLSELQAMVVDALRGVREIGRDLRPLALEDLGLVPALRSLVRAAREGEGAIPDAKLRVTGQPILLSSEQELALYRITQEALTNIRKHARATGVRVDLVFDAENVRLEVTDDGEGFEVPASLTDLAQRDSFGLMGIQERVWAVSGMLSVQSAPGRGTQLRVMMPIAGESPSSVRVPGFDRRVA
jgi:two-component system sensor histidine kinase UhpB